MSSVKKSAQKLVFFVFVNFETSLLRNLGLTEDMNQSNESNESILLSPNEL